jgi:hypothetical protein
VDDNPIVEISATDSTLLHSWSPLDFLDPQRVTYSTYESTSDYGVDNEHANAVIEDPRDNSLIVSFRNQNAVIKFTRAGQLKWILGPPANWGPAFQPYLFTPAGSTFNWNYGQHAPEITPQGTLLLYNDGIDRASPFDPPVADKDNYSSATEYQLDETNMVVSQVWDSSQAKNDRLFTRIVGDADWQPLQSTVLVTYGYVSYVNGVHPSTVAPDATMVRIIEYTHDPVPEVVFDLSFFDTSNKSSDYQGYLCYRSDRIHDLYAHPASPVTDLLVVAQGGGMRLLFSGDPVRTYSLESSTDLATWAPVPTAVQDGATGEFSFELANTKDVRGRFYRVVTH